MYVQSLSNIVIVCYPIFGPNQLILTILVSNKSELVLETWIKRRGA